MNIANGIIGLLLLTLGRKLFWLFVGCLGFIAGLQLAEQHFGTEPFWLAWTVALVLGIIGALLAVFFQNVAIIIGGFIAGSTIAAYLAMYTGFTPHPVINVCGGILGTIVLYALFDYALIGLSSFVGATIFVEEIVWSPKLETIIYVVLIVTGILFQTVLWRRNKS
ncbi:MAG: DUF4203 domain-containing protein [Desulfopila sp.]|jgi:hypothetical protein|nr:DUF4203 domain-containing protein [Desulfopila sp.]